MMTSQVPAAIFVIEDDPDVAQIVVRVLREQGYEVLACPTAHALFEALMQRVPDLCIVDLGLPDAEGMEIVHSLQTDYDCGVLILSGRGYLDDRVTGLELGADDYVMKPFEPRELVARVGSILRRYARTSKPVRTPEYLLARFAGWEFDLQRQSLKDSAGKEWPLSNAEAAVLLVFLQRPNRILTREHLQGDEDIAPQDRSIDVRISRLRRKLEHDETQPRLIRTIYGAGYLFSAAVEWS